MIDSQPQTTTQPQRLIDVEAAPHVSLSEAAAANVKIETRRVAVAPRPKILMNVPGGGPRGEG